MNFKTVLLAVTAAAAIIGAAVVGVPSTGDQTGAAVEFSERVR